MFEKMKINWKNPNTTLVFCLLRVIPVIVITIAIVIIIVTVVVTIIVIYIVINISTAVLFSLNFIRYLEDQWISGPHPPYTWNCFGRVEDATNNAQEAFNGVLNRLIKVKNPHTNE